MNKKILILCLIMAIINIPTTYGENIDDLFDMDALELTQLVDVSHFEEDSINFESYYFSATDGIRDVVTYVYNGKLKDGHTRCKIEYSKTLSGSLTEKMMADHLTSLEPIVFNDPNISRREREPGSLLALVYSDVIIRQDNDTVLSFNFEEMQREWYPSSGAVAPFTSNIKYMTPEQVEQTSRSLGFDYEVSDTSVNEGDAGVDHFGPFVYGQLYSLSATTCEMAYAVIVNDTTFYKIRLSDLDAKRYDKGYDFRAELTELSNALILSTEEKIMSLAEEITRNSENTLLTEPSGILKGSTGIENAYITFYLNDDDIFYTVCDEDGDFTIDTKLSYEEFLDQSKDPLLRVELDYFYEDMDIFEITYNNDVIYFDRNLEFTDSKSMAIDFFDTAVSNIKTFPENMQEQDIKNLLHIHDRTSEIYRFYRDKIGISVHDKKEVTSPFQVEVFLEEKDKADAYYSSATENIYIQKSFMAFDNPNSPKNREWHEYNHFVQDMITGLPFGITLEDLLELELAYKPYYNDNHKGYINSTTADSYLEGFAEFMSLVASDVYGDAQSHVYANFGSMELDRKAYTNRGVDEEFAVAGILWDLYDGDETYKNGSDDDKLTMPLDQIMNILFTPHLHFTEVYEAFKAYYKDSPEALKELDQIFINHGFFIESTEGNKIHDQNEPYKDGSNKKLKDKSYTIGEHFIDYPTDYNFSYDEGEKIGTASNYERPEREMAAVLPGHLVHIDSNQRLFLITVDLPDTPHLNFTIIAMVDENSNIQVPVPPEGYFGTLTISDQTGKTYSFTTDAFYAALDTSIDVGYFETYSFPDIDIEPVLDTVESAEINKEIDIAHYDIQQMAIEAQIMPEELIKQMQEEIKPLPVEQPVETEEPSNNWLLYVILITSVCMVLLIIIKIKRKNKNK